MEYTKFYAICWAFTTAVLIILIGSVTTCSMYTDFKVAEMVNNGADPLDALCATSPGSVSWCQIRAAKGSYQP